MKVDHIVIGFWHPQSTIHLKEFYDAISDYRSSFFDKKILQNMVRTIKPTEIEYITDQINIVRGKFKGTCPFEMLEDGLVMLQSNSISDPVKTYTAINKFLYEKVRVFLRDFFRKDKAVSNQKKGTPKAPVVIVVKRASDKELESLFAKFNAQVHKRVKLENGKLWIGEKVVVLVGTKLKGEALQEAIRYLMFARLYELKLTDLLNTQRKVWQDIQTIRRKRYYKNVELPDVRDQAFEVQRAALMRKSDLKTLEKFLQWREQYIDTNLKDHKLADTFRGFFASLKTTHSYLSELWEMTHQYADATLQSISLLYSDNERRELHALQRLFLISTVIGVISLGTVSGAVLITRNPEGMIINTARFSTWNMESFLVYGFATLFIFLIVVFLFSYVLNMLRMRILNSRKK